MHLVPPSRVESSLRRHRCPMSSRRGRGRRDRRWIYLCVTTICEHSDDIVSNKQTFKYVQWYISISTTCLTTYDQSESSLHVANNPSNLDQSNPHDQQFYPSVPSAYSLQVIVLCMLCLILPLPCCSRSRLAFVLVFAVCFLHRTGLFFLRTI